MGGFLYLSKPKGSAVEEAEKRFSASLAVFEKKGLPLNERLISEDFVVYVFHKKQFQVENVVEFDDGQFIVSTGTCIYNRKIGHEALVELFDDFDPTGRFLDRVLGHYCLLIYKNGTLHLLNDYTGLYHVFTGPGKKVISSSLLAVSKSLDRRKVASQELYEYILTEAYHGDRTLIEDVDMVDCRSLWRISPDFQSIEKPMPFSGLKEKDSFEGIVEEIGSTMTDYFSILKDIFGNRICTALSAGFDSRGMLAYLRKVGVTPYVYVYGSDSSLDVSIARGIARDEGFDIDVADRDSFPIQEVEDYVKLLAEHFYMYDGLGYEWGVFGSGFDMATRSKRSEKSRLQLQGGGGEVFRNRWLLTDKSFNAMSVLKSRWGAINPDIPTDRFDNNEFFDSLLEKSRRIVNIRNNDLDRKEIEILHPFFALNYWLGNNNRINNQYAYAMTPYMNLKTVMQSFDIPLRFKNHGKLHSALIKDADPDLAGYPSQYGHDFFDFEDIPIKQRMVYALKLNTPIAMRSFIKTHFWKKGQFHRGNFPYFLQRPYLEGIFGTLDLQVSEYVNLEGISNHQMFSRALSAELLLRDIF